MIIRIFFLCVGFAVMYLSYLGYEKKSDFSKNALHANGYLIRYDVIEDVNDDSVTYLPIIGFIAHNGETIRFKGSTSASYKRYGFGENIAVLYENNNPHHASIDSFIDLYLFVIVMMIFGIVITGISIFFLTIPVRVDLKEKMRSNKM